MRIQLEVNLVGGGKINVNGKKKTYGRVPSPPSMYSLARQTKTSTSFLQQEKEKKGASSHSDGEVIDAGGTVNFLDSSIDTKDHEGQHLLATIISGLNTTFPLANGMRGTISCSKRSRKKCKEGHLDLNKLTQHETM